MSTDPTGSAVDETEDPQASTTATLEAPEPKREDTPAPAAPEAKETAKPSAPEGTSKPASTAAKPAKPAETKTKGVDLKQATIDRLRSDKPTEPPAATSTTEPGTAAAAAAEKAGDTTPPGEKPAQERTPADANDPVKAWPEDWRKHTKGAVKDEFRKVAQRATTAETALTEAKPYAELGKAWNGIIEAHSLEEDWQTLDDPQIAWSLKAQASAVRAIAALKRGQAPAAADLKTVSELSEAVSQIGQALGIAKPQATTVDLPAFTGELPADLVELKELGVPEADIKDLAALRAQRAAAAKAKATPPAPAAPAQTTPPARQPAPAAQRPAPPAYSAEEGRLWAGKTEAMVMGLGKVPKEQVQGFIAQRLAPLVVQALQRDFPGKKPDAVFSTLSPAGRHALIEQAMQDHAKATAPPATTPPSPTPQRPLRATGQGRPTAATIGSGDLKTATIAHLASDG